MVITEPDTGRLLEIVGNLAREMHASRPFPTLDMSLERDLGLDSLARVELSLRMERAFGVRLSEEALGRAETVRDLWNALGKPQVIFEDRVPEIEFEADAAGLPHDSRTLAEVLNWHLAKHPDRLHILVEGSGEDVRISYAELGSGAVKVANSLVERGIVKGESVAIMLPTGKDYFCSFFGAILAGCIPVPIYPPFRLSQIKDHFERQAGILSNAQAVVLITFSDALGLAKLLRHQVLSLQEIVTPDDLVPAGKHALPVPEKEDIALLQYTSGSTGSPKGVMLSHANLLANIRAMGEAAKVDASDVFVSWLPLYHDMGLIGAWLGSLYHGCRYIVMSPMTFLARPSRWLFSIARHRATLTASPNFGYALCLAKIDERDLDGLDLSSLRMAFDGAEPVSADVILGFAERFGKYGLRENVVTPVYGLAESSVGLAFTPSGRGAKIDCVDRNRFMKTGKASPAEHDGVAFVSCGLPLPGHEIRVVDEMGHEVGNRQEGRLEFRGPSATRGYFRNSAATARLMHGQWLDSGDYAYIAEGEVYPTGRAKDLIIRAGRNIYPYEAEEAVGNLPGVRRGCVAIFGVPRAGTEQLVVMAETKEKKDLDRLHDAVENAVIHVLGEPPDEVLLVSPHTVPKTSSGKIRRAAGRALYLQGMRKRRFHYVRWLMAAFMPKALRFAGTLFHAAYVWIVFGAIAPAAWLSAAASSNPAWNWKTGNVFAKLFLGLSRIGLTVRGIENIPSGPSVFVANHASYLDGIILIAALSGNFAPSGFISFVAKKELKGSLISRLYLEHLGAEFVERSGLGQDAHRLENLAKEGRSMLFFPEGTFTRIPGLARFRMGAFLVASRSGLPVVPLAIRGARSILRDGSWFPRMGKIEVDIGIPVLPQNREWHSAIVLRDTARAEILLRCGEPDLLG